MSALLVIGSFASLGGAGFEIFGSQWWIIPTATAGFLALTFMTRNARPIVKAIALAGIVGAAVHDASGWSTPLVALIFLGGLLLALGLGLLMIEIRYDGIGKTLRRAVDFIHPKGEFSRQAKRHRKLLEPGGMPFPVYGLVPPTRIHRELWLELDPSSAKGQPRVLSGVVFESPESRSSPRWRVRVESRPHAAPTAHDSDDSDEDDNLFADLQARVAADPQILRQVAKLQEEGGTWDDLAALGRLISSDPAREPAAQTPITIAVDGRPEKFVVDPAGHGQKASGLVDGCSIALSIDGISFTEVALQQVLDPLSFLYPGHTVDGNATAPS